MNDKLIPAIDLLVRDVAKAEKRIAEMKKDINLLCKRENIAIKYDAKGKLIVGIPRKFEKSSGLRTGPKRGSKRRGACNL